MSNDSSFMTYASMLKFLMQTCLRSFVLDGINNGFFITDIRLQSLLCVFYVGPQTSAWKAWYFSSILLNFRLLYI